MNSNDRTFLAYLDEMNLIVILLPLTYHQGLSSTFTICREAKKSPLEIEKSFQIKNYTKYICRLSEEICFGKQYWIIDEHGGKTDLQVGAVIRTKAFDSQFYYDGNDLGAVYEPEETRFKLWAPTAVQVKLKLRPPGSPFSTIIKMKREDQGIWSLVVKEDLELYQYSYYVQINQEWREAVDPYVKAVSDNGEHGVIVNLKKTYRPKVAMPPLESPVDAIIYETHFRDFTIHPNSGAKNKGLYLGAGEGNTAGIDGQPTGLSYVKDLGITHIQFLPFHDFAGVDENNPMKEYNWGYNPLHYNAPEGSYSTDPSNPYSRIMELKQAIEQIHQAGLKVIMDVVYNHVYIREQSSFERIVPGYYFRHDEMGLPSNGTGVGNDFASERKMARKFIVDSIRFWMEEYGVDGFRFDLMGILDIETMRKVRAACDKIANDTILIGEGWNMNTPLPGEQKAIIKNQAKLQRVAFFNDQFRDIIKGSTFNLLDKGYAAGNERYTEQAIEAITGSIGFRKKYRRLFTAPIQSVNYVECHDNHTLWDKLLICLPEAVDSVRMKHHRLATGIVILSQGIPFLHSGQEFFRTKQGDGNSYRSSDLINQLDWIRKSKFKTNVDYVKGLIEIRKGFSCFRMKTAEEIRSQIALLPIASPMIGLALQSEEQELMVLINPTPLKQIVLMPNGTWMILADHQTAGISPIGEHQSGEITLEPISLNVFLKK